MSLSKDCAIIYSAHTFHLKKRKEIKIPQIGVVTQQRSRLDSECGESGPGNYHAECNMEVDADVLANKDSAAMSHLVG